MKPLRDDSEQEQTPHTLRREEPRDEPERSEHEEWVRESAERLMDLHDEAFRRLASS